MSNRIRSNIRITLLCFALFFSNYVSAQFIHYQGAVRNQYGLPLGNQNIKVRITIIDEKPDGKVEYWEVRDVKTNSLGLYSFSIGDEATTVASSKSEGKSFASVDWSNVDKYIKVGVDVNAGNMFYTESVVKLNSVPYAIYAKEGGTSGYNVWKKRPENIGKTIDTYLDEISTGGVADKSIGTIKLKDEAVTGDIIADAAVADQHIKSISAHKINPGKTGQVLQTTEQGVEWANIDAGDQLNGDVEGSVSNNRIKDKAVTSAKIADRNVTVEKLTAGSGADARVGIANADGTVVYQDFKTEVERVQKQSLLQDGVNTKVVADTKGNIITYQVNVATAKGSSNGGVSQLGLVKEQAAHPFIGIDEDGALYLNEELMNKVAIKTDDYSATRWDKIILGNAQTKNITITLPSALTSKGKTITVKKYDSNEDYYVNVVGEIAGLNQGQNQLYTALPYTGWVLISDGTQWQIINKF